MRTSVLRSAALALLLVGAGAACTSPVRLATPAEIKQAQATPTPAAAAALAPNPAASPGTGAGATGTTGLAQLQAEYHALIAAVLPSIVEIDTSGGLGSGVVMDAQGDIATNAHVVAGETSFTVRGADGAQYPATLVAAAASNDLAVIRATGAGATLKPATFGDSSKVALGDIVVAIGSPLGLSDSVSEGIVSGTGRTQPEGNGVTLTDLIQTTAAINPGNSGGALVDIAGQVVGMPTLGASSSPRGGAAGGIGFAISSNQVVNITQQLVSGGAVTHTGIAYLGITTSDAAAGGAQVNSVVAGGPAGKAGVKAGWVITAIGGKAVPDANGVGSVLSSFKPGQKVDVKATLPDGSTKTVSVTLGERP
ncbi:MAG TPA: trypsin-like peptidase domain-containing protein [Candidatus Dormibacteraeota bacterium]